MLAGREDDPSSVNVSEIETAIVKIEAEEGTVAAFPAEEIFEPTVKTIEYRGALLEQLRADKERWIALLEKKKRAADKELLAKYLIPLDEKYRLVFDYVPDGDPFYERANTLILHTPIAEEAALVVEEYEKVSGVSFSLLDLRTVADDFTKDLPELFRVVAMRKIHLLLEGIGDFLLRFSEEEAGKILIDLIRIGKSGCKIVLLDRDGKEQFVSNMPGAGFLTSVGAYLQSIGVEKERIVYNYGVTEGSVRIPIAVLDKTGSFALFGIWCEIPTNKRYDYLDYHNLYYRILTKMFGWKMIRLPIFDWFWDNANEKKRLLNFVSSSGMEE